MEDNKIVRNKLIKPNILENNPFPDRYLFDHKSHPMTKIVIHPGGRVEYCCPYNGIRDGYNGIFGPNNHFIHARAQAHDRAFVKKPTNLDHF